CIIMETPNNNQQTTGLQIFFKEDIDANVRVKVINGAPWFVGKDVAASLGYTKTRNAISQHVDNEDALKQGVPDNQGFIQETILINESGMYALFSDPSYRLPKHSKDG
ncbi:phage anti-repressor protein, partial [human gut metagenome]